MTLKDGKFYEGDVVVPIEFGNKEQIRLMEEANKRIYELENDGVLIEPDIEFTFRATAYIKCICGSNVYHSEEESDTVAVDPSDSLNDLFDDIEKTCNKCKRKYRFSINDDDDLVYKLVK